MTNDKAPLRPGQWHGNDGRTERDMIKERRYIRLLTRQLLELIFEDEGEHISQYGMVQALRDAIAKLETRHEDHRRLG